MRLVKISLQNKEDNNFVIKSDKMKEKVNFLIKF